MTCSLGSTHSGHALGSHRATSHISSLFTSLTLGGWPGVPERALDGSQICLLVSAQLFPAVGLEPPSFPPKSTRAPAYLTGLM